MMYLDSHFRHVDLKAAMAKDSTVAGLDHAPVRRPKTAIPRAEILKTSSTKTWNGSRTEQDNYAYRVTSSQSGRGAADTSSRTADRASRYVYGLRQVNGPVRRCFRQAVTCVSGCGQDSFGGRMGRDLDCAIA
jgi:hypothetical protein